MIRPADFNKTMQAREFVPQAMFLRPISYFAGALKVVASEGDDDLDYYKGLAFLLDDLIPVVLMHYQEHPSDTTTMYLPFEIVDLKLITCLVGVVLDNFNLQPEAVSWQRQAGGERLLGVPG